MKRFLLLIFLLISKLNFAAGLNDTGDTLHESGKIYVVVAVLLIIFAGIVTFLFLIDSKIRKIEKRLE
jgi:NADH:ubiquinone oxidoreductase subunit 3 (subunit A)